MNEFGNSDELTANTESRNNDIISHSKCKLPNPPCIIYPIIFIKIIIFLVNNYSNFSSFYSISHIRNNRINHNRIFIQAGILFFNDIDCRDVNELRAIK